MRRSSPMQHVNTTDHITRTSQSPLFNGLLFILQLHLHSHYTFVTMHLNGTGKIKNVHFRDNKQRLQTKTNKQTVHVLASPGADVCVYFFLFVHRFSTISGETVGVDFSRNPSIDYERLRLEAEGRRDTPPMFYSEPLNEILNEDDYAVAL